MTDRKKIAKTNDDKIEPSQLLDTLDTLEPSQLGLIDEASLTRQFGYRGRRTLRIWFSKGRGPKAIKIGTKLFFRISSVQEWLSSIERAPVAQPPRKRKRSTASASRAA